MTTTLDLTLEPQLSRPLPVSRLDFVLPPELEAHEPPEATRRSRSDVRLMVSAGSDDPVDATFDDLPRFLRAGDLLVVNTSATVPAAVNGTDNDTAVRVHFSTLLPGDLWLVELRTPAGLSSTPWPHDASGTSVFLDGGAALQVLARFRSSQRLYFAKLILPAGQSFDAFVARHGQPIRYQYVRQNWPISTYQTVFATEPGSAEMPSAARPFTTALVTELVARGVGIAPLVLHTGVSSGEVHEPPYPERYRINGGTAERINTTHATDGRVIAVGTTVVRAIETTADEHGRSHPGSGWTDLVISPQRGMRVVDGLITGWHEPKASHLLMLEAIAGLDVLRTAYTHALDERYRWHEFGDTHLIIAGRARRS
jgi:S-adenosylmethionine:tRNA ribosyltransferase-isomerase